MNNSSKHLRNCSVIITFNVKAAPIKCFYVKLLKKAGTLISSSDENSEKHLYINESFFTQLILNSNIASSTYKGAEIFVKISLQGYKANEQQNAVA